MQKVFILGIGNPEEKYNNTRHNIGKDWVEKIAKDHGLTFVKKSKLKCSICEVEPYVYLVVPNVYVNESGIVASLLKRYLNAKPEYILVLHDDIDLQIGDAKFKSGGGDGGHNGLKDLSNVIGKDFKRLKIGVSHPGRKNEVTNWVLGKFKPSETQLLEELYKKVMAHKEKIFSLEIENLQNLVN
ncbi:aminoacyl-tRNA hydrolase [Pseudomonadota bacterium]|nr:aminoacyl-tRNA hydrolase [Pseudomonadota bacterium]